MDYLEMGRRIKQARSSKRLTQRQLANMIGVSVTFISQIERGKSKTSVHNLYYIVNVLQVSFDYLISGKSNTEAHKVIATELIDIFNLIPNKKKAIIFNLANDIFSLRANDAKIARETGAEFRKEDKREFHTFLGKRIKQIRKDKRLLQSDLAKKGGISINFVSQIERCKSYLSVETLEGIADALNVTVDLLTDNMFRDKIPHSEINDKIVDLLWRMSLNERLFLLNEAKKEILALQTDKDAVLKAKEKTKKRYANTNNSPICKLRLEKGWSQRELGLRMKPKALPCNVWYYEKKKTKLPYEKAKMFADALEVGVEEIGYEDIEASKPNNIYKLRMERGWTQKELGQRMTPNSKLCSVSPYEIGKAKLSWERAKIFADAFGVDVKEIGCDGVEIARPNNIYKLRLEKGWSQDELGRKMNPKSYRSHISLYELGRLKLSYEKAKWFAEALGVDAEDVGYREAEIAKPNNICKLRLERGWTQEELGRKMTPRMSPGTISFYETGKHELSGDKAKSFADALRADVKKLTFG